MSDPVAEARERLSEFVAMRGGWMGDEDGPDYREFLRLRDALIAAVRRAALFDGIKAVDALRRPCVETCDSRKYGRDKFCSCGRADERDDLELATDALRRLAEEGK